jgi:hypothetical protein
MDDAIPAGPHEIEPAWLSARLGGRVEAITVEEITDRRGVNGETFRLHLRGEGVPSSVVAKFPGEGSRGVARYQRWYEREVRFYRELGADTPLRSPRCFAAEIAPSDDFVVLLEDLGSARQGDQVAGCTPEEAERAVRALGAMHARWWDRTAQPHEWLPFTTIGRDRARPVQGAFARAWERVRPLVPPTAHAAIDGGVEAYVELIEEISDGPVTLCHGDFRLDNLFWVEDEVVAFDWQFACRARGTYDVAYFLALDLEPDVLATHEERLLAAYLDALVAGGVTDYAEALLRRDYAISLILATAVFAIGAGSPQPTEASRVMHEVGLARLGEAIARAW